jgi:uncharacterized protein (DUF362 family)
MSPYERSAFLNDDEMDRTQVALVKTKDRASGVRRVIEMLGFDGVSGRSVFLKPNYNSADPAPGSTHPDVLGTLVMELRARGATRITVGDRSGMGDTRQVMERLGVFRLAGALGFEPLVFDELHADQWVAVDAPDSHWSRGFAIARPVLEADVVVQTCCLKTHQYGGHFTLSLKNSVGFAAKTVPGQPYDYMNELHQSRHQRLMIAEINVAYEPALIVMDGVEAFVTGGPATGKKVSADIVLAGTDRVAIDAVGVALLRKYGTTRVVSKGDIFNQPQIRRAVELGLGVEGPDQIELITDDRTSATAAAEIQELLRT